MPLWCLCFIHREHCVHEDSFMRNMIDNYSSWNPFNRKALHPVSMFHSAFIVSCTYHFVGGYVADILENLEMAFFCCIFVVESQRKSSNHTCSSFHSCHHHLDFAKPKFVGGNPKSGIFQWGFQCGFSVGFSVGSSVGYFSITVWYIERYKNQCRIILFLFFWSPKWNFPVDKTLLFTLRNHIFHKAKPYLLQGETLSFARRNLIFHKAKPYLLQGKTISFTRWNHIFHKAKPYLLHDETISFAWRNLIFYKVKTELPSWFWQHKSYFHLEMKKKNNFSFCISLVYP